MQTVRSWGGSALGRFACFGHESVALARHSGSSARACPSKSAPPTPLRIAKNGAPLTSSGDVYAKGWFDLSLPNDDDQPRRGQLSVPNIDRKLSSILLALTSPPRIKLTEVLSGDPDTPLAVYDFLFLRGVQGDAQTISGSLEPWTQDDTEPAFAVTGTQDRFPGLYL